MARLAPLRLLVAVSVLALTATVSRADDSLARKLPSGAIVFAELQGLDEVITKVKDSDRLKQALESDLYKQGLKNGGVQRALAGKKILESQIGMDLWTLSTTLLGGRVAAGLYPSGENGLEQPNVVLVLESENVDGIRQLREKLQPFIDVAGEAIQISKDDDGIETADLDGQAFAAAKDGWIILANKAELRDQTLDLRSPRGDMKTVADDDSYQAGTTQLGEDHHLRVLVDTKAIAALQGGRAIPKKLDNPLASLLFGGISELAATADAAGLTLDLNDDAFQLTIALSSPPEKLDEAHQVFFSKPGTQGTKPFPVDRELLAGFTFYRNIAEWYMKRDELIEDSVLPEYDKFEQGLANILPGKDFGTEVLPMFGPTLTFLAAPQRFDHLDGKPGVVLPGFAMIADLQQPDEAETIVQLFFQTLTSLLNIQAGQQGRQPWLMQAEVYNGVSMTYGKYLKKPQGDRLPIVFNFMPAAARVGNRYILSSSVSLCRDLIDDLKKGGKQRRENRNLHVELRGEPIANAVEENRETLVAQGVREGKPQDQASAEVDLLVKAIRAVDAVRLTTGVQEGGFKVRLSGQLKQ